MSREIGKHPALGAAYGRDDSLDDVQPEGPHGSDKYRPGDFVGGYGAVAQQKREVNASTRTSENICLT